MSESEPMVREIALVADETATSRCDEGFLRVKRFVLRNTFTDGRTSDTYRCDVLSRRHVDAVAVVLYSRHPESGRPIVHYREGTRPPIWLRRHKQDELPFKDPAPFDTIGEIVAGVLEETDHDWEGVLRRGAIEAHEEAGYRVAPDAAQALGQGGFFPSPGVTDEKVYLVAVEVDPTTRGEAVGDGSVQEQGTRMVSRDLGDAVAACRRGEIPDAKTEIGILRLADLLGYLPQLDLYVHELPEDLRARYRSLGVARGS
ncbi:MAG: NUDIX hydrolase [Planctomycetota bacterium]